MKISSHFGVWMFVLGVTLTTVLSATLLNFLIFPSDILPVTVRGTVVICILVTVPTCLFIGKRMYENQQLSDALQDVVERDRLTNVATRDFFFSQLALEPDAFGVSLMVDIDHFKKVNDTHGHLAGDNVIHAVAQILKGQVREDDIVCRFGGEEFVVFLRRASPEEGWKIAERIRSQTETTTTSTSTGDIKVTVSVGGSLKDQIEHIDDAIKRADTCLYQAKRQGRNRAVVDWKQDNAKRRLQPHDQMRHA